MQADNIDSPLSVLKTFIAKEIVPDIKYTKSYEKIMIKLLKIQERTKQSLRSLFDLWEPVTEDDIWLANNSYAMYWCKDHIFSIPIFSRIIRRDKFERIRKMLHFTDPISEDPEDSLIKLRGFLEKLGNSFRNNYIPN